MNEDGEGVDHSITRALTLKIMHKLKDFGGLNIRDSFIRGFPEQNKKGGGPKMRYNFIIEEREQALACYKYFLDYEEKQRKSRKYNN